jgi:hypothetical protein
VIFVPEIATLVDAISQVGDGADNLVVRFHSINVVAGFSLRLQSLEAFSTKGLLIQRNYMDTTKFFLEKSWWAVPTLQDIFL